MWIHYFTVRGSATFPDDMLRYDACYPARQESAELLHMDSRNSGYLKPRDIEMVSRQETKAWKPTEARWASFGWAVFGYRAQKLG